MVWKLPKPQDFPTSLKKPFSTLNYEGLEQDFPRKTSLLTTKDFLFNIVLLMMA